MTPTFPPGIAGEVSEGGGRPPLLWAHGLTSSRADEDQAGLFRWNVDRPVIRWDAPGHGRSRRATGPDEIVWAALGNLMVSVADGHGVERFVAGGASMGAATSLWAAVAARERVAALLLVVPPTAWETRRAQADVYRSHVEVIETRGLAALAELTAAEPLPPVFDAVAEQVRAARRDSYLAADPANLAAVLRGAAGSDLPPREALTRLDVPALVLAWSGDPGHPVSTAQALGDLLPRARVEVAADIRGVLGWPDLASTWLDGLAE